MSMTDPIADLLTRIRNGIHAGHNEVRVPASRIKLEIVKILAREGYVDGYEQRTEGPQGTIEVRLKEGGPSDPTITGLARVSRPGRRVYCAKDEIPKVLDGLGISILSTSRGVLTGTECRARGVGGELLCKIW
jgi:small subunit ribosomal protein S8